MKSERIEINKKDGFEIVIKSFYDDAKQSMLVAWVILWTIAGIGIITQFFVPQVEDFKIFLAVWLAFWAYFEYKVIFAFRWRKHGLERIILKDEMLTIIREISGRGLPEKFDVNWIKNLRKKEIKENNIIYSISKAYWNPGDERIVFDYKGKEVYFGKELNEKETKSIIHDLEPRIKEMKS